MAAATTRKSCGARARRLAAALPAAKTARKTSGFATTAQRATTWDGIPTSTPRPTPAVCPPHSLVPQAILVMARIAAGSGSLALRSIEDIERDRLGDSSVAGCVRVHSVAGQV